MPRKRVKTDDKGRKRIINSKDPSLVTTKTKRLSAYQRFMKAQLQPT